MWTVEDVGAEHLLMPDGACSLNDVRLVGNRLDYRWKVVGYLCIPLQRYFQNLFDVYDE